MHASEFFVQAKKRVLGCLFVGQHLDVTCETDGVDWRLGCALSTVRPLLPHANPSPQSPTVLFFYLKKILKQMNCTAVIYWTIYPTCDFTKCILFSIRWRNVENKSTVVCPNSCIKLLVFVQVIRVGVFPPFWACAVKKLWVSSISASRAQLPGRWGDWSLGCSFGLLIFRLFILDFPIDNCTVVCKNWRQCPKCNA